MSDPIVYIDTSELREGKLEELRAATKELAAFVDAHNPHVLSYEAIVDRLDQKAEMLGSGSVAVHSSHAGFAR